MPVSVPMQRNGWITRVAVRVTYCVVQTLRTMSFTHGAAGRRCASDRRIGYDHLNCRVSLEPMHFLERV
jgi:hypothetical protein